MVSFYIDNNKKLWKSNLLHRGDADDLQVVQVVQVVRVVSAVETSGRSKYSSFQPIDSALLPALVEVPDTPGLPRVLLIGDSISIGYTLPVRARLAGRANVHRPRENGCSTGYGLERLDAWLGQGPWAVIHFNFGLHDLKYLDAEGNYGIAAINRFWNPETGWDRPAIERLGLILVEDDGLFITGIARMIGQLVKYHAATGYAPALKLATLLKDKAVNEIFLADGAFDPTRFGTHGHSITSVMSSLVQLGEVTRDSALLKRVRVFVENGLKTMSDDIGWSIERPRSDERPDLGEANNTGDILETFLILGRHGYPEYLHRGERLLRGHLLPCQLRDVSFIPRAENPCQQDGLRNVAERSLGSFGFPAPYGHKSIETDKLRFNMDIVGGVVDSLCEAYDQSSVFDDGGHRVNLLFDHETNVIKIGSPYPRGGVKHRAEAAGDLGCANSAMGRPSRFVTGGGEQAMERRRRLSHHG